MQSVLHRGHAHASTLGDTHVVLFWKVVESLGWCGMADELVLGVGLKGGLYSWLVVLNKVQSVAVLP